MEADKATTTSACIAKNSTLEASRHINGLAQLTLPSEVLGRVVEQLMNANNQVVSYLSLLDL